MYVGGASNGGLSPFFDFGGPWHGLGNFATMSTMFDSSRAIRKSRHRTRRRHRYDIVGTCERNTVVPALVANFRVYRTLFDK